MSSVSIPLYNNFFRFAFYYFIIIVIIVNIVFYYFFYWVENIFVLIDERKDKCLLKADYNLALCQRGTITHAIIVKRNRHIINILNKYKNMQLLIFN